MTRTLTWILSATLATACAAHEAEVEYASTVNVQAPDLVAIGPDVDVVIGAREPVFRTNNAFWLYRGDRWYRSDELRGGTWVRIVTPPRTLTAIVEPTRFANYRVDRTVYRHDLTSPQAPYPPPPQPTVPGEPGGTDVVPNPQDPTLPSQPDPMIR